MFHSFHASFLLSFQNRSSVLFREPAAPKELENFRCVPANEEQKQGMKDEKNEDKKDEKKDEKNKETCGISPGKSLALQCHFSRM
jgi:hypothetical protein